MLLFDFGSSTTQPLFQTVQSTMQQVMLIMLAKTEHLKAVAMHLDIKLTTKSKIFEIFLRKTQNVAKHTIAHSFFYTFFIRMSSFVTKFIAIICDSTCNQQGSEGNQVYVIQSCHAHVIGFQTS